jgi:hypothetical protein
MIPLGYMAKRVATRSEWLKAPHVSKIYSVSACISEDFGKWIDAWKHNGYWFFNSPRLIEEVAAAQTIDLAGTTLFYYEGFETEYHPETGWMTYQPEPAFPVQVLPPASKTFCGFDVVTFHSSSTPECSPLSCNGLAAELKVNEFCLLPSLEETVSALEAGRFSNSEPGPYRIIAVYTVDASPLTNVA